MRLVLDASVAGALARQGRSDADIVAFVEALLKAPHEVVTVGPRRARAAMRLAIACKLRGADATYLWLGAREGVPVCTLDREMLARGAAVCQLMGP